MRQRERISGKRKAGISALLFVEQRLLTVPAAGRTYLSSDPRRLCGLMTHSQSEIAIRPELASVRPGLSCLSAPA